MVFVKHLAILVVFSIVSTLAQNITFTVNPLDGQDVAGCGLLVDCKSINFAVYQAFNLSTPVHVTVLLNNTAGPYTGVSNSDVHVPPQLILVSPLSLTISSMDTSGVNKVVIECTIAAPNGWTVDGFTGLIHFKGIEFRGCEASAAHNGDGGCMYFNDVTTRPSHHYHSFEHVVFDRCKGTRSGAGLWMLSRTEVAFVDVAFSNNAIHAPNGALIGSGAGAHIEIPNPEVPLFFERLTVSNNEIHGDNVDLQGGGLFIDNLHGNGTVEFVEARFFGNWVDELAKNESSLGGGMYLSASGGAFLDVTFTNNTARYGGGLLFSSANRILDLCVPSNKFIQNTGFGLYVKAGEVLVDPISFEGNTPNDGRALVPGAITECTPFTLPPEPNGGRNNAAVVVAVILLIIVAVAAAAFAGWYFFNKRVAYRNV